MTARVRPWSRLKINPLGLKPRSVGSILLRVVIVLIALVWLLPTIGLLITSLRPEIDAKFTGWWNVFTNPNLTFDNYAEVLQSTRSGFGLSRAFLNSLAIAIPATLIPLTIASFAGYGFSWMTFKGRDKLFISVVALVIVPGHIALIPLLSAFTQGVHVGSFLVIPPTNSPLFNLWIVHTAYGLPLATYMLRNFMASLPSELVAAARVDGADDSAIFRRVVLPLSVPAIASFAIFQFLWVFNDFLGATVFIGLDPDTSPITVRLVDLAGSRGEDRHLLSAGAFLSMALPLLVFLSLQRYFIRGLTAGAVKD